MKVHTGDRPYMGSVCDKSFVSSGKLTTHMKTHSEETPYTCKTCGKSFKQKSNLTVHQRLHTKEGPSSCSFCHKVFNNWRNLSNHMRYHKTHLELGCNVDQSRSHQETLTRSDLSITEDHVDNDTEQTGLPASRSTSKDGDFPGLHDSEDPYIINIKTEVDM